MKGIKVNVNLIITGKDRIMKTIKAEIIQLKKQKVVELNQYKFLKRMETLRRYLKISDQKLIQTDEGVWSIRA